MRETIIDGIRVPKNTQIYVPVRVHNMWHELWGADAELYVHICFFDFELTVLCSSIHKVPSRALARWLAYSERSRDDLYNRSSRVHW